MRFLILVMILIVLQTASFSIEKERSYAVELEYGTSQMNLLPPNEVGRKMYSETFYLNPVTATIIWSSAPKINIGISFSNSNWKNERNFHVDGDIYTDPTISINKITPFFDLGPYLFGNNNNGITEGFFVEVGPSFVTAAEAFEVNGDGYSFSTSGTFLDINTGFRNFTKEPLSLITRARLSIPLIGDSKKSKSGFSLSGASSISLNFGACFSF